VIRKCEAPGIWGVSGSIIYILFKVLLHRTHKMLTGKTGKDPQKALVHGESRDC
jgi:hypothetical protein